MNTLVPVTSTTLLRDVADAQHARWKIFHSRYEPMMRAYLRDRFPLLDADEIIQETMVSLVTVLAKYVYKPEENGRFHNYLTGVLRNKALKALDARQREREKREGFRAQAQASRAQSADETFEREWRESIYDMALKQLLADEAIHERTKQVFLRLVVEGEKPEQVAEAYALPYNTVVKMKARLVKQLRGIVKDLQQV